MSTVVVHGPFPHCSLLATHCSLLAPVLTCSLTRTTVIPASRKSSKRFLRTCARRNLAEVAVPFVKVRERAYSASGHRSAPFSQVFSRLCTEWWLEGHYSNSCTNLTRVPASRQSLNRFLRTRAFIGSRNEISPKSLCLLSQSVRAHC